MLTPSRTARFAPRSFASAIAVSSALTSNSPELRSALKGMAILAVASDPSFGFDTGALRNLFHSAGERLVKGNTDVILAQSGIGMIEATIAQAQTRNAAEALLKHPENTAAFKARWKEAIAAGDPFYNPHYASEGADHVLRRNRADPRQVALRVTRTEAPNGNATAGKSLAGSGGPVPG